MSRRILLPTLLCRQGVLAVLEVVDFLAKKSDCPAKSESADFIRVCFTVMDSALGDFPANSEILRGHELSVKCFAFSWVVRDFGKFFRGHVFFSILRMQNRMQNQMVRASRVGLGNALKACAVPLKFRGFVLVLR